MNASLASPGAGRDRRLDVFRGLALLTIFVNHVPGNVYEHYTSRNFGFSDAAEAFVLMSGIAVGLAYARGFGQGDLAAACMRVWRRAGVLYVVHIATTALAIAIVAAGVHYLGTSEIIERINLARLVEQPFETMIGIPLLGHQLGYFNILPLYAVLLLLSPLYILIGLWSRVALLAVAVLVWAVAGSFRVNLPNYPNPGGWFFNPFAWQLIYAVGIAGGLAMAQGRKLVRFRPWLFWLCVGYLAVSCLWVVMRAGPLPGDGTLPFFLARFDKTFLAVPRLSHALALAYVLVNMAWVSRLFAAPIFRPVELMGRNGLAVFATGSVLAIALQVLRLRFETSAAEDGLLLAAGIAAQIGAALLVGRRRVPARPAAWPVPQPTPASARAVRSRKSV